MRGIAGCIYLHFIQERRCGKNAKPFLQKVDNPAMMKKRTDCAFFIVVLYGLPP